MGIGGWDSSCEAIGSISAMRIWGSGDTERRDPKKGTCLARLRKETWEAETEGEDSKIEAGVAKGMGGGGG